MAPSFTIGDYMEDLLKVGVITTTHGVRGEVKVYPTTDGPERFLELEYVLLDTGREPSGCITRIF